jgi:hypothetical protein
VTPPATAAARQSTRPATRPTRPAGPARRVSGPARKPVAVPRRAPRRTSGPARPARALDWVRALPEHRLLDRLIGGRIWIVLLGTLLAGIVTLQLSMLKLNAGIGHAIERSAALEQRNATLRASISRLSDSSRVVAEATRMGLVMPPQGSPRYRTASADDARAALMTMRVPNATTIVPPVVPTTTEVAASAPDATVDPTAATTTPDPTATPTATTDPASAATPAAPADTGAASATTLAADPTTTLPAGGAAAPVQE